MEDALEPHAVLNKTQRCLIGAYFLHEYSFEASALFNPSIVRHPDQSGAPANGCRFILSLRAVGEGHISSLTFRSGTIGADGSVAVDPTARLAAVPKIASRTSRPNGDDVEVMFRADDDLSERVIFPITDAQANGIEDARFVAIRRRRANDVLRDLHGLQRQGDPLRAARDDGFPIVPDDAAGRHGGAQQGHGAVPAQDRRPLRDDRAGRTTRTSISSIPTISTPGTAAAPSFSPSIPGSSCRSAVADRRSSSTTAGCC